MFKPRLDQQEQGFTLVEVLVAIVLALTFTTVAMQAIVLGTVFKVRARQLAEATTWIQEDLETVKQQSFLLKRSALTAAHAAGATTLYLNSLNGFVTTDVIKVGTDPALYNITSVSSTNPPSVTLASPGLALVQPQGTEIITTPPLLKSASLAVAPLNGAVTLSLTSLNGLATTDDAIKVGTDTGSYDITGVNSTVNPPTITINPSLTSAQAQYGEVATIPPSSLIICTPTNSNDGFGKLLENNLPALNNNGIKTITNKTYTLVRNPVVKVTAPFEVLQLSYTVAETGKPPIAKFNTEVVPDAFFRCP